MYCLQQCKAKKILRKTKLATVNHFKSRSASKGDAVHLARLEIYCGLPAHAAKSDFEFGQVIFPIEPIKGGNR